MALSPDLRASELDELRIGWDLIMDLDARSKLEHAQVAAVCIVDLLKEFGITPSVKFSGCTVHFVDETVDGGPIITQAAVPVLDDDTPEKLAERILKEEHRIYTEAINIVLSGKYKIVERRVLRT